MWAALLGTLVLGERLTARRLAALALGLAGMALLFEAGDDRLGPALVLLSAVSWGAGTVAIKHYRFQMPVTVLTAWQHLVGVAPIVVGALIWDVHNMGEVSAGPTLAVLYNMTVTSIFCYWAYFKVVSSMPVVVSTVGTLMVPVIGVFSSALVLGEATGPRELISLTLVCLALGVVVVWPALRDRGAPDKSRAS